MNRIKKLNWFGFIVVFSLGQLAALTNENVLDKESVFYLDNWLSIQIFLIPICIFILIVGRNK